jgi:hypothetical protein
LSASPGLKIYWITVISASRILRYLSATDRGYLSVYNVLFIRHFFCRDFYLLPIWCWYISQLSTFLTGYLPATHVLLGYLSVATYADDTKICVYSIIFIIRHPLYLWNVIISYHMFGLFISCFLFYGDLDQPSRLCL